MNYSKWRFNKKQLQHVFSVLILASFSFASANSVDRSENINLKKQQRPAYLTEDFWLSQAEKNQGLTQSALTLAMIPRCIESAPLALPLKTLTQLCTDSTITLFKALDAGSITLNLTGRPRSFTVAFRNDLFEVLKDRRLSDFIRELNQERDFQMLFPNSRLSVAKVAEKVYLRKADLIRVMATVFQNTSSVMAHLDWLGSQRKKMNALQRHNLEMINSFYSQMSMDRINSRVSYEFLSSEMTKTGLTPADSYHFYVPAYLFLKTYRVTKSAWSSWSAAYLFNYMYEIATSPKTRIYFLSDPTALTEIIPIRDIYAGYYSIAYLLGPHIRPITLIEFSRFAKTDNRKLQKNLLKVTYKKSE